MLLADTMPDAPPRCPPDVCVAAVLVDALRRVAVLGGRDGMARSLGSVYGGAVTRFLGGGCCRGVVSRVIDTPVAKSECNGIAVSVDGSTLLVTDWHGRSQGIHEISVGDGSVRRVAGSYGDGPLQFASPGQVCVAPDDFVFVADFLNHRVQVLTPSLEFHAFVGVAGGDLERPGGVCANDDVIVVSEEFAARVSVFRRGDGALLRRFGSRGSGDGQLLGPLGLCFMPGHRHVAVADSSNDRVSVFSVDGEFVRHVGVGQLTFPHGVACSAFGEIVVADTDNRRVVVFSASGDVVAAIGSGTFTGVAVHGGTIFAQDLENKCVVFE